MDSILMIKPFNKNNIMNFQIASSAGSKYFDLEASGSSDRR